MKKLNSQLNQNITMDPTPAGAWASGAVTQFTMVCRTLPCWSVRAMAPPSPMMMTTKPMDWQPFANSSAIWTGVLR